MKCCGKEVQTSFCPHCGKEGPESQSLNGLLVHCRENQRQRENHEREWSERLENGASPENEVERERYLAKKHRVSAKWRNWADALQELINAEMQN